MDRYCLFGYPVEHSKSPEIHQEFARQTGEELVYEKIEVEKHFETAAMSFFAAGGCGANVTLPHKQAALEYADMLTGRAKRAGAVNTLMADADGIFGDNTDGVGLLRDLTVNNGVAIRDSRVLVLGASGAARGILGPLLAEKPAEIVIANRTPERAERLAEEFGAQGRALDAAGKGYDLVINATSASLQHELPLDDENVIREGGTACDLVYLDEPTLFLRWAQAAGAGQCIDGWGMLVEQAAESFALWRGIRPETAGLLRRNG
ncbi:MAG: shikimate dehydrogenase [Gammaproteobacteria bacterium]|nr:shikimate dehydrogenase [Gammaproteobacteria bacterium]